MNEGVGRGGGKTEKRVKEEVNTSGKKKKKGQKWKTMGEDMRYVYKMVALKMVRTSGANSGI